MHMYLTSNSHSNSPGTTTATVLARAIYSGGVQAVGAGMDAAAVRRGIDSAASLVAVELDALKKSISTPEEILQVVKNT